MNQKDEVLYGILDIAIGCCASERMHITREDVIGKSREAVLVWIRAMVASLMQTAGFLPSTVAKLLNRTAPSIRHLMSLDTTLKRTSKAYRIAYEEALLLTRKLTTKEN